MWASLFPGLGTHVQGSTAHICNLSLKKTKRPSFIVVFVLLLCSVVVFGYGKLNQNKMKFVVMKRLTRVILFIKPSTTLWSSPGLDHNNDTVLYNTVFSVFSYISGPLHALLSELISNMLFLWMCLSRIFPLGLWEISSPYSSCLWWISCEVSNLPWGSHPLWPQHKCCWTSTESE